MKVSTTLILNEPSARTHRQIRDNAPIEISQGFTQMKKQAIFRTKSCRRTKKLFQDRPGSNTEFFLPEGGCLVGCCVIVSDLPIDGLVPVDRKAESTHKSSASKLST